MRSRRRKPGSPILRPPIDENGSNTLYAPVGAAAEPVPSQIRAESAASPPAQTRRRLLKSQTASKPQIRRARRRLAAPMSLSCGTSPLPTRSCPPPTSRWLTELFSADTLYLGRTGIRRRAQRTVGHPVWSLNVPGTTHALTRTRQADDGVTTITLSLVRGQDRTWCRIAPPTPTRSIWLQRRSHPGPPQYRPRPRFISRSGNEPCYASTVAESTRTLDMQ